MRIRPRSLAAGAALLVALPALAAGCGSSSSGSSGAATSTATTSGTTAGGAGGGAATAKNAPNPNGPEVSPSGDIPDNQAYVAYAPPAGGVSIRVPEGWSRSAAGGATTFPDKLHTIRIETVAAKAAPTVGQAQTVDVPQLAKSVAGFQAGTVTTVARPAGTAVRVTYQADSKPNAVTGKAGRDAVERYVFFHRGRDVVVTLSGPRGADNVDPWRIITGSVRWTR
jgi:hypothetical protein